MVMVCADEKVQGNTLTETFIGAPSFSWTLGSTKVCHQNVQRICGVSAVENILSANDIVQIFADHDTDKGAAQFILIHAKLADTSFWANVSLYQSMNQLLFESTVLA